MGIPQIVRNCHDNEEKKKKPDVDHRYIRLVKGFACDFAEGIDEIRSQDPALIDFPVGITFNNSLCRLDILSHIMLEQYKKDAVLRPG
jgi:hypothetical protein